MYRRSPYKASAVLLAALAAAGAAQAQWIGGTSNDFNLGGNWTGGSTPALTATWQVNSVGTQGGGTPNSTLNVSAPISFSSTGGKIAFGDSYPVGGLSGSDITFFNGTVDAIGVGVGNANTITVANNLVLGNGAGSTISFTTRNTSTGLLRVTGSVTGGTGGTAGALILSLGSTSTHNGSYDLTGNLTRGGATSLQLTKRGTGTATLTGTNVVVNLGSNEAGSTIRINGGETNILNAAGGRFGVANQATSVIRVSSGTLNAFDSRNVRNSLQVDGGALNLGQASNESAVLQSNNAGTGARLSFNAGTGAPAYTLNISSGNVNFLPAGGTHTTSVSAWAVIVALPPRERKRPKRPSPRLCPAALSSSTAEVARTLRSRWAPAPPTRRIPTRSAAACSTFAAATAPTVRFPSVPTPAPAARSSRFRAQAS